MHPSPSSFTDLESSRRDERAGEIGFLCSKYRLLKGLAQDVDLLNFFSSVDVASSSQ